MKATELLHEQHLEILQLFDRCEQAGTSERRRLSRQVRIELRRHTLAEEEVFYPALRRVRSAALKQTVRHSLAQHNRLDGLIAELEAVEPDDARFGPRLEAVRAAFAEHVEHEEVHVFAHATDVFGSDRLEKLGGRLAALADRDEPER